MPIYEYECRKCNERFESFRGIFDSDRKVACPVCGEKKPQRIISRVHSQNPSGRGNLTFST